jgi:hypothetical protein
MARRGGAWQGRAWLGSAGRGGAWRGKAKLGAARHGKSRQPKPGARPAGFAFAAAFVRRGDTRPHYAGRTLAGPNGAKEWPTAARQQVEASYGGRFISSTAADENTTERVCSNGPTERNQTVKRKQQPELADIAHHEAGHAVIAFALRLPVVRVHIIPDQERGRLGCCEHPRPPKWFQPE